MKQRLLKSLIAFAGGCLLFLSCADFDIWPLAWVAWVPIMWIALDEKTERAWWYGFVAGLAGNGGGFYWFVPYLQKFAHLPFIAAAPIFLLLISYQAITWSLFCHLLRRLRKDSGVPVTFLAPVVYVAVELVVPYIFVWYLAITQAWVPPVIQIAELTGPLGVSFLLILVNAAIYEAVREWRANKKIPRRVGIAFGIVAACLAFGFLRIHQVRSARDAAPKVKIGVVQANIGIHQKWRANDAHNQLTTHQQLSAELQHKGAELILWPESSYPYAFRRDQTRDWPEYDPRRARVGFDVPLLFGTLTLGSQTRYPYNSAMLLDKDGNVSGLFDKNILIVFGEYIPYFEQMKFIKRWVPEAGNFARGTDVAVFDFESKSGKVGIGPMICYEDIFPAFGRRLAQRGPNLLVNLTNDAWFGNTSEPWEHMALSVYRAVETRLDLVRAVNTGVSAFIDSTGKVYAKTTAVDPDETPDAKPMTLLEDVAVQKAQTLYATVGEWFGIGCLLVTFLLFVRVRRKEGAPIQWLLVAKGAAALLGSIMLVTVLTGPSHLGLVLKLLARRVADGSVSPDLEFAAAWRLLLGTLAGSLVLGWFVAWSAKGEKRPLERALAVVAVWAAPAFAIGTLEGQQAGLVIGALGGILLARLGGKLAEKKT